MKKAALLLAIALLFMNGQTVTSQKKFERVPDAPGKWTYTHLNESKGGYRSDANYVLSPTELAAFKKKITQVVTTLQQNPVTANPIGFEPTVTSAIFANMFSYNYDVNRLAGKIPQAEIVIRFCILYRETATGKSSKDCMEVEHCDVWLNSMDRTMSSSGYHTYIPTLNPKPIDEAFGLMNEVFQAPEVVATPAEGVTLYANGRLVLARTDRPIWIPVTAGEYFDLQIRYWTLTSARDGNSIFLDMLKKEKATFSEADLKKPAYNGENPASLITVTPNKRPYMRFNPAYFDKQLPRSHVQLITVALNIDLLDKNFDPNYYRRGEHYMDILRYYEYSKALDPLQLKALLDVK